MGARFFSNFYTPSEGGVFNPKHVVRSTHHLGTVNHVKNIFKLPNFTDKFNKCIGLTDILMQLRY